MANEIISTNGGGEISGEVMQQYLSNGYTADDAALLESVAQKIGALRQRTAEIVVEIGQELLDVSETIKHGSWQFFVENRVNMVVNTAQRFMAAARIVREHKELLEPVLGNIAPTALYLLGQNKKTTIEAVRDIAEIATDFEVDAEMVREKIAAYAPSDGDAKPAKAKKNPLPRMKEEISSDILNEIQDRGARLFGVAAMAGLDAKQAAAIVKLPKYKDFVRRIMDHVAKGTGENETEQGLSAFLLIGFIAHESFYNPPMTIDADDADEGDDADEAPLFHDEPRMEAPAAGKKKLDRKAGEGRS